MKLFGIYDSVANEFVNFFSAPNENVALRSLKQSVTRGSPLDCVDFQLTYIGDLEGQKIINTDMSYIICDINSLVIRGESENE